MSNNFLGRTKCRIGQRCLPVLLCALVFVGCSRAPYPVAPTRGVVTIDDKPVPGGKVMFAPIAQGTVETGKPAFGELHPDGTFELSTFQPGDGAIVGEHWVTLIGTKDRNVLGEAEPATTPKLPFTRVSIPQKRTISANIENHIEIRLTSGDVKKFDQRGD